MGGTAVETVTGTVMSRDHATMVKLGPVIIFITRRRIRRAYRFSILYRGPYPYPLRGGSLGGAYFGVDGREYWGECGDRAEHHRSVTAGRVGDGSAGGGGDFSGQTLGADFSAGRIPSGRGGWGALCDSSTAESGLPRGGEYSVLSRRCISRSSGSNGSQACRDLGSGDRDHNSRKGIDLGRSWNSTLMKTVPNL